jgi:hypothetical protein
MKEATGIIATFFSKTLWIGFSKTEQVIARRILESLTASEGRRNQLNSETLGEIVEQRSEMFMPVLNRLIERRLVRRILSEDSEEPLYELVHDFLGKNIYDQLSDEERKTKEIQEILMESVRRWEKLKLEPGYNLLELFYVYREKLKFTSEAMNMIVRTADEVAGVKWVAFFGVKSMSFFLGDLSSTRLSSGFFETKTWNMELLDHFIMHLVACYEEAADDDAKDRCLYVIQNSKDPRVMKDLRIQNITLHAIRRRTSSYYAQRAWDILLSNPRGIELLKKLKNAIKVVLNFAALQYGGDIYGFNYHKKQFVPVFLEVAMRDKKTARRLLLEMIWNPFSLPDTSAMATELLLAIELTDGINVFKEILVDHRYVLPRLSAATALEKIGNLKALCTLAVGLADSSPRVVQRVSKILAAKGYEISGTDL